MNEGQAVTLPCSVTPGEVVTWIQVQNFDVHFYYIYTNGEINFTGIKHRYNVSDPVHGNYTLTIINIQVNDAGRYFCLRGQFIQKPHYVTNTEHLHARTLKLYIIYVTGKICELFNYATVHSLCSLPFCS